MRWRYMGWVVGLGLLVVWQGDVGGAGLRLAQVTSERDAPQMDGTQDTYRYEAKGRRDPFESLVQEKPPVVDAGPLIDPNRPRGPLERFDISTLQLRGIIWGELGRRAIIRAPDGKGYFVTVGMYMGQNGGQIVAIEDDRLVIKEKHRDLEGRIIEKTLTLPLRRKDSQQG